MVKSDIEINCEDGIKLGATLFQPEITKAGVMIAPATGIRRQFYHSFASFLADSGYGVITFDNRGIGDSAGKNINQVDASLINWGKLDMVAVLEKLKSVFPDVNHHLLGHSAGGQLIGLMKNAGELKSVFNFACSSGSIRNSPVPFKYKSYFFLRIYIPVSNFLFGKTQSQWVGMGEPLPKMVGAQWSRWCNGTGYVKVDLDTKIKKHWYYELDMPTLWLHASDDPIANFENVKDMIRVMPRISSKIITLDPGEYSFHDIGHMKFFSSKRRELWKFATDWLGQF